MKRLLSILRSHGVAVLVARAAALARRTAAARLADLRDRIVERRDAALPRRPFTVTFPEPSGPVGVSVFVLASSDDRRTSALLRMLERELKALPPSEVFTIRNPSAAAVATQLAQARGAYVYFVSGDAVLHRGCIAALLKTLERHPGAAACVSALRSDTPAYVHPVEHPDCASLLWRRSDLPAAACTDALAIDPQGRKVLLQPRSRVDLRSGNAPAPFERNRPILAHSQAVLVVDDHVPFEDRDAGSERIAQIVRLMRERAHVIFASVEKRDYGRYGARLLDDGIELICGLDEGAIGALATRRIPIKTVWLSRPDVAARFLHPVRRLLPQARIVYDTVDLHFLRLKRQQEATGIKNDSDRYEDVELALARASDATVVTNEPEAVILREKGIADVRVVAMAAGSGAQGRANSEGRGMLFFGNYAHDPNVDAAVWLAREILPRVRDVLPDVSLTIAGSDPTLEVKRLACADVTVTGYVADLDALIARHRLAVLPLRFGAGIKGKVLRAMACGIPVITTRIGAEGIAQPEAPPALAETTEDFVREIVFAYSDQSRWDELSRLSLAGAQRFSHAALAAQVDAVLTPGTA